jgi:NADPH:quinone reductase-like Zn-dependent oxidoreductase
MNYNEAVAITLNYTVGYILLFELGNLRPGRNILVHSVGGGVVRIFFLNFLIYII